MISTGTIYIIRARTTISGPNDVMCIVWAMSDCFLKKIIHGGLNFTLLGNFTLFGFQIIGPSLKTQAMVQYSHQHDHVGTGGHDLLIMCPRRQIPQMCSAVLDSILAIILSQRPAPDICDLSNIMTSKFFFFFSYLLTITLSAPTSTSHSFWMCHHTTQHYPPMGVKTTRVKIQWKWH